MGRSIYLKGGGAPALPNFWGSLIFMHIPFDADLATTFDVATHVGRGLVLGISHASTARGGFPALPILGFPFCLCVHSLSQTTRFDVVNRCGGRACILVSHASHPKSQEHRVPALPNFRGSPVFMPTPFNAERLNSAW